MISCCRAGCASSSHCDEGSQEHSAYRTHSCVHYPPTQPTDLPGTPHSLQSLASIMYTCFHLSQKLGPDPHAQAFVWVRATHPSLPLCCAEVLDAAFGLDLYLHSICLWYGAQILPFSALHVAATTDA